MLNLVSRFREYNEKYFNNSLPKCRVEWGDLRGNRIARSHLHGVTRCEVRDCKLSWIVISRQLAGYDNLALMSLLHEMCHLKTANRGMVKRGEFHGYLWQKEMKRLAMEGAFYHLW